MLLSSGKDDPLTLQRLDRVPERGTIRLVQEIWTNLDPVVRTDTYEEAVERGMMQAAKRQPFTDHGLSLGFCVRDDVCSVE